MNILCIGDSNVRGELGASFISYLEAHKIWNKGLNGDTTIHTFHRLSYYLKKEFYQDVEIVVIGVGTNDVVLPYYGILAHRECLNSNDFIEHYEKMIMSLKGKKDIIILSLNWVNIPELLEEIEKRNTSLQQLCKKHHVSFIDCYTIQKELGPDFAVVSDGVHLSQEAAKRIAEEIKKVLL